MNLTVAAPANPPTPALQVTNFVLFQTAWFAAVLSAAHQQPGLACVAPLAVMGWHLWMSRRRVPELQLMLLALAIGIGFESINAAMGAMVVTSGSLLINGWSWPAPWLVLMWGLLAVGLNVTLRWLKPHLAWASLLGAVAGPLSYAAGVRLGALQWNDMATALLTLALGWAVLMPLLIWLARRFDGVAP